MTHWIIWYLCCGLGFSVVLSSGLKFDAGNDKDVIITAGAFFLWPAVCLVAMFLWIGVGIILLGKKIGDLGTWLIWKISQKTR